MKYSLTKKNESNSSKIVFIVSVASVTWSNVANVLNPSYIRN